LPPTPPATKLAEGVWLITPAGPIPGLLAPVGWPAVCGLAYVMLLLHLYSYLDKISLKTMGIAAFKHYI
jgi:hypothetical protein